MIVQELRSNIASMVNRIKVLEVRIVICALLAILVIAMPCSAEIPSGGTAQVADEFLRGFLVGREFVPKDESVALASLQGVNGIAERSLELPRRVIKSADLGKPEGEEGKNGSNDSAYTYYCFHWGLPLLAVGCVLYALWLRRKLALYQTAMMSTGIYFVGSAFHRGEKGIRAVICSTSCVQEMLAKELRAVGDKEGCPLWYVKAHERLMAVPGYAEEREKYILRRHAAKHAPHGGDDAKLPDAKIAVKNYQGEET